MNTVFRMLAATGLWWLAALPAVAADGAAVATKELSLQQLFADGGTIGYIIVVLSLAMVALVVEQLWSVRSATLMPPGLAEDVHVQLTQGNPHTADERCRKSPSFLASLVQAGLAELPMGHAAVEKAIEDAAIEQSARLYRRIEYLSLISTIAPMLGLLGTVWGMILAFMEFASKGNPTPAELAPGVYRALVTTLFGLIVAIPAVSAFAFLRNRIDELVAKTSLLAGHLFSEHRRQQVARRKTAGSPPG